MTDTVTQRKLEDQLECLKQKSGMGLHLKVIWAPGGNLKLCGEVRDSDIFIYEEDGDLAVETLRHEFFDFLVSQAIKPYKKLANMLIRFENEQAYKEKERVVESLKKLLV